MPIRRSWLFDSSDECFIVFMVCDVISIANQSWNARHNTCGRGFQRPGYVTYLWLARSSAWTAISKSAAFCGTGWQCLFRGEEPRGGRNASDAWQRWLLPRCPVTRIGMIHLYRETSKNTWKHCFICSSTCPQTNCPSCILYWRACVMQHIVR